MLLCSDYKPEFDSLRDRLVELAQIRNVDELLQAVVKTLAGRPHIVLARIWLKGPGDQCVSCHFAERCLHRETCLRLVATAGSRRPDARPEWSRLEGEFSRIPLGSGKIGRVGATGQSIVVKDFGEDSSRLLRYRWAAEQQIRGLNLQPIRFKDEVLGVLAIFTSIPTPEAGPAWLRIFADEIAAALINARAFEEIERLRSRLELENSYLQEEIREAGAFGEFIGENPAMLKVLRQVARIAPTDATVLVLGESGTGKELIAREIHRRSRRNQRPLIRVNCASVPRELYESEFFGHVKGAFTGAIKDRAGRFEAADEGSLLLDEVGEIPAALQSKFLRVLQEKQYERVGEEKTRTIDVRIIAATNRDLKKEVEEGRFRQDLYYRLNVLPIRVPPLRDRLGDIPLLAQHFIALTARRLRLSIPHLSDGQVRHLQAYHWPGNVRELQNVVERAVILSPNGSLEFDIPGSETGRGPGPTCNGPTSESPILTEREIRQLETKNLIAALEIAAWKIHGRNGAAELLGVKPTTLISRIKKLRLTRPERESVSGRRKELRLISTEQD